MRTTTAYFAGVGTVIVAVAAGLGGGLLIADVVNPHGRSAEVAKLERRKAEPVVTSTTSAEPVPYLAATQAAATNPVVVSAAPEATPQPADQPPSPAQAAGAQPPVPPRDANPPAQPAAKTPPPVQSGARDPSTSSADVPAKSSETLAKARDADSKRETRRADERRKAERRQQWAERRRNREPHDDLRDVERSVREETEQPRMLAAEPARTELPVIKLFGDDD